MPSASSSFDNIAPIPPQVSQIGYGIFQTPVAANPNEFTAPALYSLFVAKVAPTPDIGVVGDWYEWIAVGSGTIAVYQKAGVGTWTLVTTLQAGGGGGGGGGGDVAGPAGATTNAVALFADVTGKVLKNSSVTVAASAATAGPAEIPRGNDPRMTNTRTPVTHASTHKSGGPDPIKLDELAAPTDVTTLNVSTTAHGLCPKLPGGTGTFFRADGTFAATASSSSVTSKRVTAQFDKVASVALADVTGLSVTLTAGVSYVFEAVLFVNTSTVGRAVASVSGTATFTSLLFEGQAFGIGANEVRARGSAFAVPVAQLEGAVADGRLQIWGTIVVNAGGTITIQFAQLTASGTSSVLVGSYLNVYQI